MIQSLDFLLIALGVCALVLTGYICYALLNLSRVLREFKKSLGDINKKLDKINPVVESFGSTTISLMETIQAINNNLLKPVASFSKVIKHIKTAWTVFKKRPEK